jgi:tetratricopeptide (TPR) repeat protein
MLKTLTTTQPTKDENFFYLGWVYIKQDYSDSAKVVFNKGIAANPKSALNYAGLGAVARLDKDNSGATTNFNQAITLAGKDVKPYTFVGLSYLLPTTTDKKVAPADADAAIAVLTKGKAINAKDVDLLIALGDAYRSVLKSNEAYSNYSDASTLDPKNPAAKVATGVLYKFANNFDGSEQQFKDALAINANYGPAYREWAETDLRWSLTDPKMASAKIKEAVDHYKQYLSLTDQSVESQMRYADFLILAGDYKTLQQVTTDLSKSASTNARVYRYLAYAAYENKDYQNGLTAINTWFQKADPKRIIPRDYLYQGRLQIALNQDSVGILTLQKALTLDSTQTDVYAEIAKSYFRQKKYAQAGDAYREVTLKGGHSVKLTDYFYEGISYYYGYDTKAPNDSLLTHADSAFSYVIAKTASSPFADAFLYRARVNDLKEKDRNNIAGYARPYYEKYIEVVNAKGAPDEKTKKNLAEAYAYIGTIYQYKEKDDAKASENFAKARELDPANKSAAAYFQHKGGAGKGK